MDGHRGLIILVYCLGVVRNWKRGSEKNIWVNEPGEEDG